MPNKMKYISIFLLISIFVNQAFAQSIACDCKTDLDFLDSKIKSTPSYKRNKEAYAISLSTLSKKAIATTSIYDCYVLLNALVLSINDNHSRVFGLDKGVLDEIRNDSLKFLAFKKSDFFNLYPKPRINLDSLTTILKTKELSDTEGIYTLKNHLTIGVFKNNNDHQFKAVVLDSETDVWLKGEIIYTFIPFGKNHLLGVGGGLSTKRLITFTERIDQGIFWNRGFAKNGKTINYATQLPTDKTYFRNELAPEITYLRIGSFSGFYPTLLDAEKFYESLEGTLTKQHLILDLRSNGGGGVRNSDLLFKILKEYSKKNKIYILINFLTASNAEQFAFNLNEIPNCMLLGQPSNGTISYELAGVNYELPSGNFRVVLTSKSHSKYLNLESAGIEPDIKFDLESDWIDQIVKYIVNNTKG